MGFAFQVSGQMGGLFSSDETGHGHEVAHQGIPVLLVVEVSQQRRTTSNFQRNAGTNSQVVRRQRKVGQSVVER
jgi:hypothetical protein